MTKKRATKRKDGSQHDLGIDFGALIAELSGPIYYTTTTGVEVECLPIQGKIEAISASIMARMQRDGEFPAIPQRIIHGAGGVSINQDIDDDWAARQDTPEADKEEWAEYVSAKAEAGKRFDARANEATVKLIVTQGIRVVDVSLYEKWTSEVESYGGIVPEDETERSVFFATGYIFGDGIRDTAAIMIGIRRASGQDSEVLSAVEDSFRSRVGRAGRTDGAGGPGTAGEKETAGA